MRNICITGHAETFNPSPGAYVVEKDTSTDFQRNQCVVTDKDLLTVQIGNNICVLADRLYLCEFGLKLRAAFSDDVSYRFIRKV